MANRRACGGALRRQTESLQTVLLLLNLICICSFVFVATNASRQKRALDLNQLPEDDYEDERSKAFDLNAIPNELDETEDDENDLKQTEKLQDDFRKLEQKESPSKASRLLVKLRKKLPYYFDFDLFRSKFNRTYSASESLWRRRAFLGKCVAVLKSRVNFRLGKATYVESVNKFSDFSAQEFRRMFMAAPPIEALHDNQEKWAKAYEDELKARRVESSPLDELHSQGADGGQDEAAELVEQTLAELGGQAAAAEWQLEAAFLDELDGAPIERGSQGAGDDDETGLSRLGWPGKLAAPPQNGDDQTKLAASEYVAPDFRPGERLDWSKHECFHTIYDQGTGCGKCYVMASVALAEFYKCSEPGPSEKAMKRKFSKDFVLDCGQKFSPRLLGCDGGSPFDTLRFLEAAGANSIGDWRQTRSKLNSGAKRQPKSRYDVLEFRCPLSEFELPFDKWGNIEISLEPRQVPVAPSEWVEALRDGPLVVSVQMPATGVDSYAGGVHDGAGCATSRQWHAMLLVGYGHDASGLSYWRFRNSFGPLWGDEGHFNLNTRVPAECFAGAVRVYRKQQPSNK